MSGYVGATTSCGRPAHRSLDHWRNSSVKLPWSACRTRFLWMDPFASRRPIRQQRTATACGWHCDWAPWRQAQPHVLRRALGCRSKGGRRSAVVQYTNLYTNQTFNPLNPGALLEAIELSALGARVGATNLAPENVALWPAIYGCLHALLQGFAIGRDRLLRPLGRAGLALHHRQSRTGRPDTLGGPGYCLCRRSLLLSRP